MFSIEAASHETFLGESINEKDTKKGVDNASFLQHSTHTYLNSNLMASCLFVYDSISSEVTGI